MDDPELARAIRELNDTIAALRADLDDQRHGGREFPSPPTTRGVLRFTEGYTIPTVVAIMEANIKLLELLGGVIRETEERLDDQSPGSLDTTRRRSTLSRLDAALADLQAAIEGGEPADPEVRRLLDEARSLRDTVEDSLAAATGTQRPADSNDRVTRIEVTGPDGATARDGTDDPPSTTVDVEAELESIKREVEPTGEHDPTEASPPGPGADDDDEDEARSTAETDSRDDSAARNQQTSEADTDTDTDDDR